MKQKQKDVLRRRRAHGESLREWLHQRQIDVRKALARRREEAAQARKGKRGVDRVPERFRGPSGPRKQYLVEHTAANYRTRRDWARSQARTLPASGNTTHVNPARDRKPGARLRTPIEK